MAVRHPVRKARGIEPTHIGDGPSTRCRRSGLNLSTRLDGVIHIVAGGAISANAGGHRIGRHAGVVKPMPIVLGDGVEERDILGDGHAPLADCKAALNTTEPRRGIGRVVGVADVRHLEAHAICSRDAVPRHACADARECAREHAREHARGVAPARGRGNSGHTGGACATHQFSREFLHETLHQIQHYKILNRQFSGSAQRAHLKSDGSNRFETRGESSAWTIAASFRCYFEERTDSMKQTICGRNISSADSRSMRVHLTAEPR